MKMSSSKQITHILSQELFGINPQTKFQSYNDLINYGSIRKQFSRLIPQYIKYQNKKYISNRNFTSNIEEMNKLKQEIISMKESISLIKSKKQKKLDQIEELRCFMRKIGNKQNNYHNKENSSLNKVRNYYQRETNINNNNDKCFRGNNNIINKKQVNNNIKGSSDEVEGGSSVMQSTSDLSSGKDEPAQAEDDYRHDNQSDFNTKDNLRCCFKGGERNETKLNMELLG